MRSPRFMSIMHQSNDKSQSHVCRVDQRIGGIPLPCPTVRDWTPGRAQPGIQFRRAYKRSESNRSRHSECLHLYRALIMAEITDEEMNQQMDLHEESVSIKCTLCEQVILRTETCSRTKCCRYYVHYDCYTQALDNQLNKGVIKEKLYCQICHSLCMLSALVYILD